MKFQIKNIIGELLFEGDFSSLAKCVEAAVAGRANLRSANLRSANLFSADLGSANLRSADLGSAKADFWAVLRAAKNEAAALRAALVAGKVNGSTYSGECAGLVGTNANARHCAYTEIAGLKPDQSRPAERFFLSIREGDTPDKSQPAKLAVEWLDEWAALMGVDVAAKV
jgi:uncharacterized protein YjbI with pentapeptide repeats